MVYKHGIVKGGGEWDEEDIKMAGGSIQNFIESTLHPNEETVRTLKSITVLVETTEKE